MLQHQYIRFSRFYLLSAGAVDRETGGIFIIAIQNVAVKQNMQKKHGDENHFIAIFAKCLSNFQRKTKTQLRLQIT